MSPFEGTQITIPEGVLHQHLGAETVLLHLTTETYYGLDEVGSRVWQLLQEHDTVDPIVAALVSEYEVDEPALRADLERLLEQLAETGLIHVERGPDG
ncbi:MAG: PqqD family protein [Acidimicrobiales bacterium]